jgi:DNA-directed RNA polymerase subunit F
MGNRKHIKTFENKTSELKISGVSGSYSPTSEEVQKMYDYLKMYFHRSQMNGLVDIDPHERDEIKKMLRLPDNYR